MRAIDILPLAPAGPKEEDGGGAGDWSKEAPSHRTFDSFMQTSLASHFQNAHAKLIAHAESNSAARRLLQKTTRTATESNNESHSTDKTEDRKDRVKTKSATAGTEEDSPSAAPDSATGGGTLLSVPLAPPLVFTGPLFVTGETSAASAPAESGAGSEATLLACVIGPAAGGAAPADANPPADATLAARNTVTAESDPDGANAGEATAGGVAPNPSPAFSTSTLAPAPDDLPSGAGSSPASVRSPEDNTARANSEGASRLSADGQPIPSAAPEKQLAEAKADAPKADAAKTEETNALLSVHKEHSEPAKAPAQPMDLQNSAARPASPSTDAPATAAGGSSSLNSPDAFSPAQSETELVDWANLMSQNGGMGVAIMDSPMKNPQETNKVAGPGVKVLPVGANGSGSEKNLPMDDDAVTPAHSSEGRGPDLNFGFGGGSDHGQVAESKSILDSLDLPSLADARLRAVDRTHDMMVLHSMRLLESKSDVLSVVLKPAVGTELSLELRQHAGGVEAQATLLRGDHQFLSDHWRELQQRLELRGVKLAALNFGEDNPANGNGQFSERQQASPEDVAQQASAFAEFAAGQAGGATARLATLHDGWESWA